MKFATATAMIVALFVGLSVAPAPAFAGEGESVKKGMKVFKKCKACHTVDKGGKNKSGPNLFGVVGRAVAGTDFKKYKALSAADGVWDEANLDKWLTNPKKYNGKKTAMSVKLKRAKDRKNVIAYLKTLK